MLKKSSKVTAIVALNAETLYVSQLSGIVQNQSLHPLLLEKNNCHLQLFV